MSDPISYIRRHIGPNREELQEMLSAIGVESLQQLIEETIPANIRIKSKSDNGKEEGGFELPEAISEQQLLTEMRRLASANQVFRSCIGMGYYNCITPSVILRNILENPGWYTQYTPYQSEISQGRLEALLNFQTMICDLTGMDIANASLLDEATAAGEAMAMFYRLRSAGEAFFVSSKCFPQTIELLKTRSEPLGIELVIGDETLFNPSDHNLPNLNLNLPNPNPSDQPGQQSRFFGMLLQYPNAEGSICDYNGLIAKARANGIAVAVAADLLALTLLEPPQADLLLGSTQRLGTPLGYGGPHAAYFATLHQFRRAMPGRLVGISVDAEGRRAYRLALQTREQHIRREKATSNICTAQALLAIVAGMYAVYHGPEGLKKIALDIHKMTSLLAEKMAGIGLQQGNENYFDTLKISLTKEQQRAVRQEACKEKINFYYYRDGDVGIALDETVSSNDVQQIAALFANTLHKKLPVSQQDSWQSSQQSSQQNSQQNFPQNLMPQSLIPQNLRRESPYLEHAVFHSYCTETAMLRYIRKLEGYDLALNRSMIPLGSCTMKLNPTSAMLALSWPQFSNLHPFAPMEQAAGYQHIFSSLKEYLAKITGLPGVSLQPNSGAQGEYSGLMVIRAYHKDRGEIRRNVTLIPSSAHGTNPASAVMAGMQVVIVACKKDGSIDLQALKESAEKFHSRLSCLMITYPSTHGVFEQEIVEICKIVHEKGAVVYMDGANMNAMVGLVSPAQLGVDVCHLNLHKTFSIPHGGGGPGMGPICVAERFIPYLPKHSFLDEANNRVDEANDGADEVNNRVAEANSKAVGTVAAAPWGSASILTISYAYIRMLGAAGLSEVSRYAILNANYIKARLQRAYLALYVGNRGRVAHEIILDLRPFRSLGIEVEDVAKRLIDYGFHAPTMSWPVAGTLMIEPTESEYKRELDRFCNAMLAIREEIRAVEQGHFDPIDNPLKNAPHTAEQVSANSWNHPYSREQAAYPFKAIAKEKIADEEKKGEEKMGKEEAREEKTGEGKAREEKVRDERVGREVVDKFWPPVARVDNVYGDRNLFCSCPPVEREHEPQPLAKGALTGIPAADRVEREAARRSSQIEVSPVVPDIAH